MDEIISVSIGGVADKNPTLLFRRSDADWHSTLFCPCGSSITWKGVDERQREWVRTHQSHVSKEGRKV